MKGKLAKNTVLYVFFDILVKIIPFLLIPIVTSFLSISEYGEVSLFQSIVEIATIVVVCGGHQRYRFLYFKDKDKDKDIHLFIQPIISSFIFFILILAISVFLYSIVDVSIWILCVPFVAFSQSIISLFICRLQNEEKPKLIGLLSAMLSSLSLGLAILLLNIGWGLEGRIWSIIFAPLIIGTVLLLVTLNKLNFRLIKNYFNNISDFIKHSLIYLPTSLSWWARNGMDRFIINSVSGAVSLGIFSLLTQLSMVLTVVGIAMNNAIMPTIFRLIKKDNYQQTFKVIAVFCLILVTGTAVLLMLFPFFIRNFLSEEYWVAIGYIHWSLISANVYIIYLMLTNLLVASNLSGKLSILSIISSFFHVALSWLLVHEYGLNGIFYSAITSYSLSIVLLICLLYFSRRYEADAS